MPINCRRGTHLVGGGFIKMATKPNPTKDKVYIIAHYFMHKSQQEGKRGFTNKKLQKMLFYAQAWSLVLNDRPLFDEKFEAWVHGAAIPKVYKAYSNYGFSEIDEVINVEEFESLGKEDRELLDNVWEVYGKYDADYLELLNHQEEPWQKARAGMPPGMASNAEISEDAMREYYGKKLQSTKEKEETE